MTCICRIYALEINQIIFFYISGNCFCGILITRIMISVIVRISAERNRVEAREQSNMAYKVNLAD